MMIDITFRKTKIKCGELIIRKQHNLASIPRGLGSTCNATTSINEADSFRPDVPRHQQYTQHPLYTQQHIIQSV